MHQNKIKPTSPHLQIYRWNISSLTSIMHRLTGVALYVALVIMAWGIFYYTYSSGSSNSAMHCECFFTKLMHIVFCGAVISASFCLYYHFCNGIRHLFWDIGKGFELKTAKKTGYLLIFLDLFLTILTVSIAVYLKFF